ncbi:ComEA family DNA-binding protein [Stygiobacter electus]|uniref:Helix-hairpin-helix domain-containing protein n=1 Tax=Stygiobacter electus TaxID=3032292 RepID=A0AAE3P187_9BACT|nr:helix-hairpin-helix domain-containing protein [Stygiobacter electus]MDF1611168.1 helix-hairpin-helix domain-containing protein [Stygiobacter electus]
MKILEKLSVKLNLTSTELKIFLFLLLSLIIGFLINVWKTNQNSEYFEFDYSKQDSIFYSSIDKIEKEDSLVNENNISNVKNDSINLKQNKNEKLVLPKKEKTNKIIKINTASENEIGSLPGIGIKTAKNIIEYRNKKGSISKAEELLNVKGIGKSKLEKIRMLLNFDK